MNKRRSQVLLVCAVFIVGILGCQRETPAEKAQSPQPDSAVDRAAQQAVDAIKTPMDKARAVEGTLERLQNRRLTGSRKQHNNSERESGVLNLIGVRGGERVASPFHARCLSDEVLSYSLSSTG